MPRSGDNLKLRRIANIILIGTFGLLLWLPTLDSVLYVDHATAFKEKRMPATFPQFQNGLKDVGEYIKGLEAYFNDHFGWRKQLIHWHMVAQIKLFKTK